MFQLKTYNTIYTYISNNVNNSTNNVDLILNTSKLTVHEGLILNIKF